MQGFLLDLDEHFQHHIDSKGACLSAPNQTHQMRHRMKMLIKSLKEKKKSKSEIIEFLIERKYSTQLVYEAVNRFH